VRFLFFSSLDAAVANPRIVRDLFAMLGQPAACSQQLTGGRRQGRSLRIYIYIYIERERERERE